VLRKRGLGLSRQGWDILGKSPLDGVQVVADG